MLRLFSGSAVIRLSGAAAQLLLTLVIARVCGAHEAGIFFFGYSILMIMSTLVRLGSEYSGLRNVAAQLDAGDVRAVRRSVDSRLAVVVTTGALTAAILACSAPIVAGWTLGDGAEPALVLLGLAVLPAALIYLLAEMMKGAQRAWVALAFQNVAVPGLSVATVLALSLFASLDAWNIAAVLCVTNWLVAMGALVAWLVILRERFGEVGPVSVSREEIRQVFNDSPSLLVVSMTTVVMQWMGATILAFLAPAAEVAGYSVAMRISIAVSIIHSAASSVVGPQMSVAYAGGDLSRLRRVCHQTGILIAFISWPILLVLFVFAGPSMAVFGSGYAEFADVLRVLLVAQFVAALIGHSGMVLVMAGRYGLARTNSVIAAMSLVTLSFIAVPYGGALGAAVAMCAAVVVGHLTGLVMVRRSLEIWTIPLAASQIAEAVRAGGREGSDESASRR